MPQGRAGRKSKSGRRGKRARAARPPRRNARPVRWLRVLRRAPRLVQLTVCAALVFALWLGFNGMYQVIRKPSELFFPISNTLYKTPSQTWRAYGPLFRRHSTDVMSPELLAAIAQVEASGNPIARTYWRWAFTLDPLDIYRPASSAVGLYQITDGTFDDARRYCIHDHAVVTESPWHSLRSCWFNALYTRVIPSHAIELTSAYLHLRVSQVLEHVALDDATLEQQQDLAAAIHLCGTAGGTRYARRGLDARGHRCGSHDLETYLGKVKRMKRVFAGLANDTSRS